MSHTWDAEARAVLAPGLRGQLRVLGGPGTGKSSLLVDAAVARIGAGVDPESVLLLTGSGRIGRRRPRRWGGGARGGAGWCAPCTATLTPSCGGPPSVPAMRRRGWSPAPN